MIYSHRQMFSSRSNQRRWVGVGLWHAWSRIKIFEQFCWGEPEGKISLRRRRRGCENDTKLKLKETIWAHVIWFHLAQNGKKCRAVSNTVINLLP